MTVTVLIAHARGEEALAAELAAPLERAGYTVHHAGTVLVGDSLVGEVSRLLAAGAPVVLCGTIRALGTRWARTVVQAARHARTGNRVFVAQMEEEADTETVSFDATVAQWWLDPTRAAQDLVAALRKYFPLDGETAASSLALTAEERYRELALETCDLVDLINLPEGDRHIATRQLELRRLYIALRVRRARVDPPDPPEGQWPGEAAPPGRPRDHEVGGEDEDRPVGEFLRRGRRLVVLGDPGAGKTTLLRWIATAYLLRLADDPDLGELPDVASLPDEDLLPVLVRCRELPPGRIGGSIDDILHHTLRAHELAEPECHALRSAIRRRLRDGTAMLLVDGLDEVGDPQLRARLCQQLERVVLAFPRAVVIATSRVVGYREMGYRLGRGFDHLTVTPLTREDKDDFARRWCAATELPDRRAVATAELVTDIHSTPRIEALTGNPMLLTTMALVKRKVGTLPSRRADLYWEAVQVLLNWRREVDLPLDHREALPQLEYVAYAMCDYGVQRLRHDLLVDLLRAMRAEYPQLHAVHTRPVEEFLRLVEARTGLLVEVGEVRHQGVPAPVYEFRHLTFQEYLAARALVEGHSPGRDPAATLAQRIAPLAGRAADHRANRHGAGWQEPIRLCVASCGDQEADAAVLAVLRPLPGEDQKDSGVGSNSTVHGRASLAVECLTDDPNVDEATVTTVCRQAFAHVLSWRKPLLPLLAGRWAPIVLRAVVDTADGGWDDDARLLGHCEGGTFHATDDGRDGGPEGWLRRLAAGLASDDTSIVLDSALGILEPAFPRESMLPFAAFADSGAVDALADTLGRRHPAPIPAACAWALAWIDNTERPGHRPPSPRVWARLLELVEDPGAHAGAVRFALWVLRKLDSEGAPPTERVLDAVTRWLDRAPVPDAAKAVATFCQLPSARMAPLLGRYAASEHALVRREVADALVQGDGPWSWPVAESLCSDADPGVRMAALAAAVKVAVRPGAPDGSAAWALAEVRRGLRHGDPTTRAHCVALAAALGHPVDPAPLIALWEADREGAHASVLDRYLAVSPTELDRLLLGQYYRPVWELEAVSMDTVTDQAVKLGLSARRVRRRYEQLSDWLGINLSWR